MGERIDDSALALGLVESHVIAGRHISAKDHAFAEDHAIAESHLMDASAIHWPMVGICTPSATGRIACES